MADILYVGSHGTDDPVMATFPFEMALAVVKKGHKATIALLSEAVVLMKNAVAQELKGHGCPPFREVFSEVIKYEIPIYV